jgi:hypothetical protein
LAEQAPSIDFLKMTNALRYELVIALALKCLALVARDGPYEKDEHLIIDLNFLISVCNYRLNRPLQAAEYLATGKRHRKHLWERASKKMNPKDMEYDPRAWSINNNDTASERDTPDQEFFTQQANLTHICKELDEGNQDYVILPNGEIEEKPRFFNEK